MLWRVLGSVLGSFIIICSLFAIFINWHDIPLLIMSLMLLGAGLFLFFMPLSRLPRSLRPTPHRPTRRFARTRQRETFLFPHR